MILTEIPRYEFYPDIGDNLSLPESERLAVEIIRPTGYQRSEFTSVEVTREYYPDDQPISEDGKVREVKKLKRTTAQTRFNADYILRNCVGKIRNLTVEQEDKDGKKTAHEITDGTALAECRAFGIEGIVSAVCLEVQKDELSDSQKKILG